jgi:flagellar motility protein MotE (MotC chaperone)
MNLSRLILFVGSLGAIALAGELGGYWGGDLASGADKPETAESAKPAANLGSESPIRPSTALAEDATDCLANQAAIEDIQNQREKLSEMRKALADKEKELQARELAVTDELKKLDAARAEIAKMDDLHKQSNQEKITKLVETLEAMPPKSAAALLSTLDDALAVTAMQQLSTPKLAKMMNLMEPARSAKLTEILAGVARARIVATPGGGAAKMATNALNSKGGVKEDGKRSNDPSTRSDQSADRSPAASK